MRSAAGQIDLGGLGRGPRRDDDALGGGAPAVRFRSGVQRDAPARHVHGCPDVGRPIAGGDHCRALENHVAAQTLERGGRRGAAGDLDVQFGVAGDVAPLRRVLQDGGEVEVREADVPLDAEIRRLEVSRHRAARAAGFGFHIQRHLQPLERPVRLHIEGRMQVVALDHRQHAAKLRQRQFRRRHGHLH